MKNNIIKIQFSFPASVFEEEDFQPLHYGFQLAGDVPEVKAMSMLKESEEAMHKLVRSTKNDTESQEHQEALAVCSRLKFYRHFFLALSFLAKQDINDAMRYFFADEKNSNENMWTILQAHQYS